MTDSSQQHALVAMHWGWQAHWSDASAQQHASAISLEWSELLMPWVLATRQFYLDFDHAPNTRVLVKYLKANVDASLSSMTLQIALGGNPALVLSYLAGIPKPKQCF